MNRTLELDMARRDLARAKATMHTLALRLHTQREVVETAKMHLHCLLQAGHSRSSQAHLFQTTKGE
jgi:hypothetical protein